MIWFVLASLIVATVVGLRALYVLGRTIVERDTFEWCNKQLEERITKLNDTNQILAAQNLRLIDYYNAQKAELDDDATYSGNIFDTE